MKKPKTLLDEMMTACRMMDKTTVPDGFGGVKEGYRPGATFQATIRKDSSTEAILAEKSGLTETFTVVTGKRMRLRQNDVIRRESDQQIFRITSDTLDSDAPDRSTIKITKCTAERWVLPT